MSLYARVIVDGEPTSHIIELEPPDTCLNRVDGHWYVVTYGRAPYQIHAQDCETCEREQQAIDVDAPVR